jgi:1,4-alpha-glucan branching enzyme
MYRGVDGKRGAALDQAIRELLLLQSSDWNFIIHTGTSMKYAEARIRSHVHRLRHLGYLVERGEIAADDEAWLADVSGRDNFLAQMGGDELRGAFD